MENSKKTAVYVGSFDPITWGHLAIIIDILTAYDQVIIAIGKNPDKQKPLFSRNYRLHMVNLALEDLRANYEHRFLTGRDFSMAEIEALQRLKANPKIIRVECFDDMSVDFAIRNHVDTIIRGERLVGDHDFESKLSMMNKMLCDVRRVHLSKHQITVPQEKLTYISSSSAKEFAFCQEYAVAANFVTPHILNLLTAKSLAADFRKLCIDFGFDDVLEYDDIEQMWYDLRGRYLRPAEYSLFFIGYCINYLNIYHRNCKEITDYNLIKAAIYYAYFDDRKSKEGREASKAAARHLLEHLSREEAAKVEKLIDVLRSEATDFPADSLDENDRILADVTQIRLGDKNNYGSFALEWLLSSSLDEKSYAEKRLEEIQKLLAKEFLLKTDYFRKKFEETARLNLIREQDYWRRIQKAE